MSKAAALCCAYIVYKSVRRRVTAAAPFSAFDDGAGMPIQFFESKVIVCDIKLVSQQTSSHLILPQKVMCLLQLDSCFVF